eukprot:scaffold85740_cov66-Phaeocystis_antarctica.AAC.2
MRLRDLDLPHPLLELTALNLPAFHELGEILMLASEYLFLLDRGDRVCVRAKVKAGLRARLLRRCLCACLWFEWHSATAARTVQMLQRLVALAQHH